MRLENRSNLPLITFHDEATGPGKIVDAGNLPKAKLFNADLSNANLRYTDFTRSTVSKVIFKNANFEFAILKDTVCKKTIFFEARNLTANQLSQAKTLYGAKLPPDIEKELRKTHPHLFEKPA